LADSWLIGSSRFGEKLVNNRYDEKPFQVGCGVEYKKKIVGLSLENQLASRIH